LALGGVAAFGCSQLLGGFGDVPYGGASDAGDASTTSDAISDATSDSPGPDGALEGGAGRLLAFAVGYSSACAVRPDHTVWCWGLDEWGEVGHAPNGDRMCVQLASDGGLVSRLECAPTPLPVEGITDAVDVAVGAEFACAILDDGGVSCWGIDNLNQLAHGGPVPTPDQSCPYSDASTEGHLPCHYFPTHVEIGAPVRKLALGAGFACAVTAAGDALCWGENGSGELGNADAAVTTSSTPVAVANVRGLIEVSATLDQSNPYACAASDAGNVWCWGANTWGQLGRDSGIDDAGGLPSFEPQVVVDQDGGPLAGATNVRAANATSCAIVGGVLRCWGRNAYRQFANASVPIQTAIPTPAINLRDKLVTAGTTLVGFEMHATHSAALDSQGTAWGWGDGAFGALGVIPPPLTDSPARFPFAADAGPPIVTRIALGLYTSMFETSDGSLWVLGQNHVGQLGLDPDLSDTCSDNAGNPVACITVPTKLEFPP
jgi:alpha-tubulin suppressor-like RCC1 family protein